MPTSPEKPRAPGHSIPKRPPSHLERNASSFDFRMVTLPLVMATRPDLYKEYLDDGKEKDAHNIPLARRDPEKWKTLRTLFDADMLAEMLYLFELPQTQECSRHLLQVFQTMVNLDDYSIESCPNLSFIKALVDYAHQQTAELPAAGTAFD